MIVGPCYLNSCTDLQVKHTLFISSKFNSLKVLDFLKWKWQKILLWTNTKSMCVWKCGKYLYIFTYVLHTYNATTLIMKAIKVKYVLLSMRRLEVLSDLSLRNFGIEWSKSMQPTFLEAVCGSLNPNNYIPDDQNRSRTWRDSDGLMVKSYRV